MDKSIKSKMNRFFQLLFIPVIVFFSGCTTSTEEIYSKAEKLMDKGEYKEAIKLYSKLTDRNPNFEDAFYYKGYCYIKDSNYIKALRLFKHILSMKGYDENATLRMELHTNRILDPESADHEIPIGEIFYQLGVVRYYLDSISASYKSFDEAIQKDAEKAASLSWQGLIWLNIDSMTYACKKFRQAGALDDTFAIRMIEKFCQ